MNFFDFFNEKRGSNRIFSREDVGAMKREEFTAEKGGLAEQLMKVGIPTERELSGSDGVVYVEAYTRDDGTEVRAHYRSRPHGARLIKTEKSPKKGTFLPDEVDELLAKSTDKTFKTTPSNIKNSFLPENVQKLYKDIINNEGKNGKITGAAAKIGPNEQQMYSADIPKEWKNQEQHNLSRELGKKIMWAGTEQGGDFLHHKINHQLNKKHKDAEYLMDLFIDGPSRKNLGNEAVLINPATNHALSKQYSLEIEPGMQGIKFKPDSSLAKTLNGSEELKRLLVNNFNLSNPSSHLSINLEKDTNIFRAIHGATLYDIKDEGDYYTAYLYDKYDFTPNKYNFSNFKDFITSVANNYAVGMQATTAENYYIIVPVRIKK